MLPIKKENCLLLGAIQKPHGLKGEVIVLFDNQNEEIFESLESCFIEIDGGLVPFFIREDGVRYRSNDSVILKFDDIDNQEKAKEISGHDLYISKDSLESSGPSEYNSFIGMEVIDSKSGELGPITAIDDFSGNIVITVNHPKGEILIPLSEEIILRVEENKLYLDCPEGLVDIYIG